MVYSVLVEVSERNRLSSDLSRAALLSSVSLLSSHQLISSNHVSSLLLKRILDEEPAGQKVGKGNAYGVVAIVAVWFLVFICGFGIAG